MAIYVAAYWDKIFDRYHYRVTYAETGPDAVRKIHDQITPSYWRLVSVRRRDNGEFVFREDDACTQPPASEPT